MSKCRPPDSVATPPTGSSNGFCDAARRGARVPRVGGHAPDGSYRAVVSGCGASLTVRVVEYTISFAGHETPELFCLITDLLDHAAWVAATELTRATARAAAATGRGR